MLLPLMLFREYSAIYGYRVHIYCLNPLEGHTKVSSKSEREKSAYKSLI